MEDMDKKEACPKCGNPIGEIETLSNGKQLQRCSTGSWNKETRSVEGCDFVRWITPEPEKLKEKCPKCSSPLLLVTTRFGKKLKRCSTNKWDPKTKTSSGCDFVEWIKGERKELDEACPTCGNKLILMTTSTGKQLKKCSTSKWDPEKRVASGCTFVEWL